MLYEGGMHGRPSTVDRSKVCRGPFTVALPGGEIFLSSGGFEVWRFEGLGYHRGKNSKAVRENG